MLVGGTTEPEAQPVVAMSTPHPPAPLQPGGAYCPRVTVPCNPQQGPLYSHLSSEPEEAGAAGSTLESSVAVGVSSMVGWLAPTRGAPLVPDQGWQCHVALLTGV